MWVQVSLRYQVTEFVHGQHVMIESIKDDDSQVKELKVSLDLSEDEEEGGTYISNEVYVLLKGGLFAKIKEPFLEQHLETAVPSFASHYGENVYGLLKRQYEVENKMAA